MFDVQQHLSNVLELVAEVGLGLQSVFLDGPPVVDQCRERLIFEREAVRLQAVGRDQNLPTQTVCFDPDIWNSVVFCVRPVQLAGAYASLAEPPVLDQVEVFLIL